MSTVTLRFPDDKHARLKELAAARQISLNTFPLSLFAKANKLLDEFAVAV